MVDGIIKLRGINRNYKMNIIYILFIKTSFLGKKKKKKIYFNQSQISIIIHPLYLICLIIINLY